MKNQKTSQPKQNYKRKRTQPCLQCGYTMGAIPGTKEAICRNCGYKDPCCE